MNDTENEIIVTEETGAGIEAANVFDDDSWGDDLDFTELEPEEGDNDDIIEFGTDADQHGEESDDEPKAAEPKETEPEQKGADADQRFSLKHMDEVREVGRDEVIQLAQKGIDYDRIRTERDSMKADYGQLQDMKAFVQELADNSGMSIADFMLGARAKLMVAKGNNLTEEAAIEQLKTKAAEKAAEENAKASEAEEAKKREDAETERKQADVKMFMATFPNVKPNDIPSEVWEAARKTGNLTSAYSAWRIRQLEEALAISAKNKKNESRSTGSRKTGGKSFMDNFDALWDDGT